MIYNNQYHSFERPILNILSVYVGAGSYTEWGCRIIAGQFGPHAPRRVGPKLWGRLWDFLLK
jgi:hypothetical protein